MFVSIAGTGLSSLRAHTYAYEIILFEFSFKMTMCFVLELFLFDFIGLCCPTELISLVMIYDGWFL